MKEKTIPFSSRIDPKIGKDVKDFCIQAGIKIQRFLEDALVKELQERKRVKK